MGVGGSSGAGIWNEKDLLAAGRDLIESDPDRGVVVLSLDGEVLYANQAARNQMRDGTPRGRNPLLPSSLDVWVDAFLDRARTERTAITAEAHYPSDAERRLRLTLEIADVGRTPHLVLRSQSAIPWLEPTVRRLQSRFGLTAREAQVAAVVARGLSNSEAAEKLGIVEKTVKNVLMSVYTKCTVRNRVELALRAFDAPVGNGSPRP